MIKLHKEIRLAIVPILIVSLANCVSQTRPPQSPDNRDDPSRLRTNQACIDIIKEFEGVRLEAYRGPSGAWLIGYGHLDGVSEGMQISSRQAEDLLREDLSYYEEQVASRVDSPVSENEFGAMVCLVYNIGEGNFASSTALEELNNGEYGRAADAILMWNRSNGAVNEHLERRREAERSLFLR